ncbi:hypothetical protein [Hyphomonas sp.]|uniref:hypothetical protein n=1 Tax=Hyphomonas sp. TaxID=87 RepID=UPI0030011E8A
MAQDLAKRIRTLYRVRVLRRSMLLNAFSLIFRNRSHTLAFAALRGASAPDLQEGNNPNAAASPHLFKGHLVFQYSR